MNTIFPSCDNIESGLAFLSYGALPCCTGRGSVHDNGSGVLHPTIVDPDTVSFDLIQQNRQRIRNRHKSGDIIPFCKECVYLKNDQWDDVPCQITNLFIANDSKCNLCCLYCFQTEKDHQTDPSYDILPILRKMLDKQLLAPSAFVNLVGGECTLNKHFVAYVKLLTDYSSLLDIQLTTNATVLPELLVDILDSHGACFTIVSSLDSATAATYKLIKGRDLFDKAVVNLRTYGRLVKNLVLKMILLKENAVEVVEFLELAQNIGASQVVCDFEITNDVYKLPDVVIMAYLQFLWEGYSHGMNVTTFGSAGWGYYDITQPQLAPFEDCFWGEKIRNLDSAFDTEISISMHGGNPIAKGGEALILNVGSARQGIWRDVDKLEGKFLLRDDIEATRRMVVLQNDESNVHFTHNLSLGEDLYIQVLRSEWSGIMQVSAFGITERVDLYSRKPRHIDMIRFSFSPDRRECK